MANTPIYVDSGFVLTRLKPTGSTLSWLCIDVVGGIRGIPPHDYLDRDSGLVPRPAIIGITVNPGKHCQKKVWIRGGIPLGPKNG